MNSDPGARWQDSVRWKAAETAARDWIEAQSAEPSVAVYYAAKTAVAADRRRLREQIRAMPGQYARGEVGMPGAVLVYRHDVLNLLGDE